MKASGLVVTCAVLAVMFFPALSPSAQFIYRDTGRIHEPNKRFVATELSRGRLAEWSPLSGLGAPLLAGSIDAVLHPFNLFLATLPFGAALKAWILASFVAAALGGRAWARALGVGEEAATLAGLVFALSGPLVSASDNVTYLTTYAALPWYFAALHAFLAAGGPGRLAVLMVASFVLAAGGDPQAWGLAVLATIPYALLAQGDGDGDGGRAVALRRGGVSAALAIVAAAPVVFPVLAWVAETGRAVAPDPSDLMRWNLSPHRLPELLLPGLFRTDPAEPESPVFHHFCGAALDTLPWFISIYVGVGAIALAILGALRRRWARWLLAASAAFTWAALGPHGGFGQLALHLPLVRGFRYWEKLTIWPALAIALCAAAGLDAFMKERAEIGPRLARAAGIGAGALLAVAALAAVPGLVASVFGGGEAGALLADNLERAAVHAGAVLAIIAVVALWAARGRIGAGAGWALAGVVLVDLIGANVGAYVVGSAPPIERPPLARVGGGDSPMRVVTAFTMRQDRWPEQGTLESTWKWGRRSLEPSWNVGDGVGNFRDYQGLPERRLRAVSLRLGQTGQWAFTGLWNVSGIVVPGRPDLAEKAGVKPPFDAIASDPELPAWIVAMPHRPRAYLAREVVATDEEGALAFSLAGGDPDRTVVEGAAIQAGAAGAGDVEVRLDRPGRVDLSVRAERPGLLVLNDAYAQGWTASVDGHPAPILRANYLVRGVWVEGGAHTIQFEYRTPGLRLGVLVALIAVMAVAAWGSARRLRAVGGKEGPT